MRKHRARLSLFQKVSTLSIYLVSTYMQTKTFFIFTDRVGTYSLFCINFRFTDWATLQNKYFR